MVLVDTSVWIGLYRKRHHRLGELVRALVARNEAAVCGPVWVEFIGGFRRADERRTFQESFAAFPWLDVARPAFVLAAELLAGHPGLGSGDAIIAATCLVNRCSLLTLDKGFDQLRHEGLNLVRW